MSDQKFKKPVVFSAMEVAKICGVVNQTAINWIHSEYLKAYKTPGGQYRVYPEDLVAFMRKSKMHIPVELLDCCHGAVDLPKKTMLIVDDDKTWNDVMKKFINSKDPDIEISQAFDGFEAGSMIVENKPRIVVLDLDLPGIDGVKICKAINTGDLYGKPHVIVMTALEDNNIERQCRDMGVVDFYNKPVNLPEIFESLEELFLEY